jgi:hypothetical protein
MLPRTPPQLSLRPPVSLPSTGILFIYISFPRPVIVLFYSSGLFITRLHIYGTSSPFLSTFLQRCGGVQTNLQKAQVVRNLSLFRDNPDCVRSDRADFRFELPHQFAVHHSAGAVQRFEHAPGGLRPATGSRIRLVVTVLSNACYIVMHCCDCVPCATTSQSLFNCFDTDS